MPASFEEILDSRIFKFTVGKNVDDKSSTFTVHEEAIAALSKPLHSLVRSGLSESETGHAIWDDVSKDTFVRFAQFAYTGDYSVPKLVVREMDAADDGKAIKEISAIQDVYEEGLTDDDGGWGQSKKKKKAKSSWGWDGALDPGSNLALSRFREALIDPHSLHNYATDGFDPPKSFEHDKVYSSAFVGHASLWILGDYQLVDTLKALALYKLHKTLGIFRIRNNNICDVVDLVRYAYSDEGAGSGEGISELRNLVCLFLAMHQKVLCKDEGFLNLLAEGGHLVKDFFKYSTA